MRPPAPLAAPWAVVVVASLASRAHADEHGRLRPPVQLELAACLDAERDAIQRAVRVELGDDAPGADPANAARVRIECAATGLETGVILDVRPPDSPRHYRYALDWHAQPRDARPRLVGLAVAEAVDASGIELTAVPAPAPPPPPRSVPAPPEPAVVASPWTLTALGSRRSFMAHAGVALVGGGLMPSRRLSSHLRVAFDLVAEGGTVLVSSGTINALSLSSAPHLIYRVERRGPLGADAHAELGIGARIGVVSLRGQTLGSGELVADRVVRAWFGPAATAAIGLALTPRVALDACLELGIVASGATARDLGQPAVVVDGTWTSLGIAAVISL